MHFSFRARVVSDTCISQSLILSANHNFKLMILAVPNRLMVA